MVGWAVFIDWRKLPYAFRKLCARTALSGRYKLEFEGRMVGLNLFYPMRKKTVFKFKYEKLSSFLLMTLK